MKRSAFLRSGALTVFAAGWGGLPGFVHAAATTQKIIPPYKRTKTLVCIFQRGAMDGLMAVSPYTDPNLKTLRPRLFMSPAQTEGGMFDLDGRFALHPSLAALMPLYKENRMTVVHGVGSPNNTRSHFDAQDFMESGMPHTKNSLSGWLNRALTLQGQPSTPFSGVSITKALPRSLQGEAQSLAISNLEEFILQNNNSGTTPFGSASSFEELYKQSSNQLLKQSGKDGYEAVKLLDPQQVKQYKPAIGATYPNSQLGRSLKQIAMLIKMEVGLEIGFAESGGWDTHINQGTLNGAFARNLKDFGDSIAAFWTDLAGYQDDVSLMTMTEFGRTVHQNGTGGTDHGRASCLFVLDNSLKGGKVWNQMGGLSKEELEDGRDLPVTTDFRSVFSAVAAHRLQISDKEKLFPGWKGENII
jgi:uncharacterized protein (DUF1501 family)